MKIALFGGTGFVGSYILDALVASNFSPKVLVRKGSESKLITDCDIVCGDISDSDAVRNTLKDVDAIIYNIGIIREFPSDGIKYKDLHYEGVRRCIRLAEEMNISRFILMSANGVRENGTGYQHFKFKAEQELQSSKLKWTIFRPSLIFGKPHHDSHQEFCSQLRDQMLSLPIPAPLFYKGILPIKAGLFSMSPVHVKNIADFFVKSLKMEDTIGKIFQEGYEKSSMDWVIRMDLDYFFHEKDKDKLRKSLFKYQDYPAVAFPQYQIFTPDRYQIKTRICLAFNKKKFHK